MIRNILKGIWRFKIVKIAVGIFAGLIVLGLLFPEDGPTQSAQAAPTPTTTTTTTLPPTTTTTVAPTTTTTTAVPEPLDYLGFLQATAEANDLGLMALALTDPEVAANVNLTGDAICRGFAEDDSEEARSDMDTAISLALLDFWPAILTTDLERTIMALAIIDGAEQYLCP